MSITRVNFATLANGGDNPTAALVKLDNNDADLDTRVTSAQSTANAALPKIGGDVTGQINNQVNAAGSIGFRMVNLTGGGMGGGFSDWVTRGTVVQLDCNTNVGAYSLMRASHWGARHLAGIDVYEGGSGTSNPQICFHLGYTVNAFQFLQGGNAVFAGTLQQNSDYRIKATPTDIDPTAAAVSLRGVRPIEYSDARQSSDAPRKVGVIAHELAAVFPLLVEGEKDAVRRTSRMEGDTTPYEPGTEPEGYVPPTLVECDEPVLQNVNYIGLVPYLIAAWKHTDAQLQEALARLQALEAKVG